MSSRKRYTKLGLFIVTATVAVSTAVVQAQNYRLRGITPVFDGWEEAADKSHLIYFGYINRNNAETTIAIGPANSFDGSQADRGQPTTFLPGRQEHVFTIKVPADFNGKIVWTLNSEMGAQAATGSLNQLYMLEQRENDNPNARPPIVAVTDVSATVGERVSLKPNITPAISGGQAIVEASAATDAAGLNVTWSKYRGPGSVAFAAVATAGTAGRGAVGGRGAGRGRGGDTPGMFPVSCGAKPAPTCGEATATFSAPGSYMLRVAARQDGMQGLGFVRVTVNP